MSLNLKTNSKGYCLTLSGHIGYEQTAELLQLAQQIAENPKPTTVVWENIEGIHYAGIQVLLSLGKSLESAGTTLRFKDPAPELYEQLRTFGIWQVLVSNSRN